MKLLVIGSIANGTTPAIEEKLARAVEATRATGRDQAGRYPAMKTLAQWFGLVPLGLGTLGYHALRAALIWAVRRELSAVDYPGLPTGLAEENDARPGRFEPSEEDWAEYSEWSRGLEADRADDDDSGLADQIRDHDSECASAEADGWYRMMLESWENEGGAL
jgi:hypothetical protein